MKPKKSSILYGILFALVALFVLWNSLLFSFACYMAYGLDLGGSLFGTALCLAGIATVAVGLVGVILGIIRLRKGRKALAFLLAVLGAIYGGLIYGGIAIDEAFSATRMEQNLANWMDETYGEGWNTPPAIEGIPEGFQEILNQFYVVVRDCWPAERLMDLGAVSMPGHYGDASLENIGFVLMDLNGDSVDELVIGGAAEDATAVFCVYTDPTMPFYSICSTGGETYYLHPGQTEGAYEAELEGMNSAFVIVPAQTENTFDFDYREGAMDPANRLALDLIPFAQYK